jgi:hypothetical protein
MRTPIIAIAGATIIHLLELTTVVNDAIAPNSSGHAPGQTPGAKTFEPLAGIME